MIPARATRRNGAAQPHCLPWLTAAAPARHRRSLAGQGASRCADVLSSSRPAACAVRPDFRHARWWDGRFVGRWRWDDLSCGRFASCSPFLSCDVHPPFLSRIMNCRLFFRPPLDNRCDNADGELCAYKRWLYILIGAEGTSTAIDALHCVCILLRHHLTQTFTK